MTIDRVLIVDDDEANRLFFEVIFGELGKKEIETASTGPEAIEIVEKNHIQLVISAWEMSPMPGTVFIQKVRNKRRKHLPYLIYSKRMTEEDIRLTKELGLTNVLSLPCEKADAKALITEVINREESLPREEITLRKVEAYLAAAKPNEALKLIDGKVLKKGGPYYCQGQTYLGEVWFQINQFDKAEDCLKKALEQDPDFFPAKNLIAKLYSRLDRHEEAIAILETLTQKSPKNITSLLNLGSAYVNADRHEDARQVFDKVSALDEDNRDLKDEQAKLAFKEGDMPLAAQLLAQTENGDMLARHFNNMAVAMAHKKDFEKAIETYEHAIRLLGEKAELHLLLYNLGLALAKKGNLQRSFDELAKSYTTNPSFEKAYAALVRVSKRMNEKGMAYDKSKVREINQIRRTQSSGKNDEVA